MKNLPDQGKLEELGFIIKQKWISSIIFSQKDTNQYWWQGQSLLFTLIIYSTYFDSRTKCIFIDLHMDTSSSQYLSFSSSLLPTLLARGLTRMKRGTPRMLHIMVVFQFWLFLTFLHYLYFSKLHLPWVFHAFQSSFPSLTVHHISVFSVSVIYITSLEWLWWVSVPSLADRHIIYNDWTWNIFSWPPKICFSDVLKQSWYLCIY